MICVKNLTKRYGTLCALDDVSFEIESGEVVGLLGHNGAGKSTAMNIITGYLSASEGTVLVDGVDIKKDPIAVKRMVGYLPENPPVYPDMTVSEYLDFVYDLKGTDLPREPHLKEIMAVVKITEVSDRLIRNLSKGYKQRVGIAQALVGDPKIVILDEPTVGLDPKQIIEVRSLIRTLAKRHTVLLSTHILSEVQAVCRRVLILNRSKLIADAEVDALTALVEDKTRYRAAIIGAQKEVEQALYSAQGVSSVTATGDRDGEATVYMIESTSNTDCRKSIFYACAKAGYPMIGLSAVGADLETVFMQLTAEKTKNETKKGEKR